jgi:hypothetical protein
MRDYPVKPPKAQFGWAGEPRNAERYWKWIVEEGWPKESQPGIANSNAGMKFPFKEPALHATR